MSKETILCIGNEKIVLDIYINTPWEEELFIIKAMGMKERH